MKRTVSWSGRALRELKNQVGFIAANSQQASAKVAFEIRQAGTNLRDFSTGRPARISGYFEKSVRNLPYILVFAITPTEDGERIVILRVIHTARDWPIGGWPKE